MFTSIITVGISVMRAIPAVTGCIQFLIQAWQQFEKEYREAEAQKRLAIKNDAVDSGIDSVIRGLQQHQREAGQQPAVDAAK